MSATRRGFFELELLDDRYPALHGARVLAILAVIQLHVTGELDRVLHMPMPAWLIERSHAVFFGMDCFFVLSGFLIGSILLRSIETTGKLEVRRFYLRRVFRTFPSYYVVLTIIAVWFQLSPTQRAHLPWEYAFLGNFGYERRSDLAMQWGWSLSLEEQFYLLAPLMFFALKRLPSDRARIVALVIAILSALMVRVAVYVLGAPWEPNAFEDAIYFRTITRFDTILAGVLLAVIERRYGDALRRALTYPANRAMLMVPALGCAWVLVDPDFVGGRSEMIVNLFRWGTLTSLMYLALVPLLIHGDGPIVRWLSRPIFRRLATLGYGVYLVHIPLLVHVIAPLVVRMFFAATPIPVIWIVTFALTVALAFVVAYAMHVLIEKPSLRLRDRLAG
jgi:peptidoglycan/LPS O-acetylase OafA/YrhL